MFRVSVLFFVEIETVLVWSEGEFIFCVVFTSITTALFMQ